MIMLVSDFDETVTHFKNDSPETLATEEYLEPDRIEDDSKRDEYLRRYNGIVISTENLCVKTILEVHNGEETSFQAHKSYFKNKFLRLSALNSKNMFQIRNEKFETLRKQEWPRSMDNY